MHPFYVVCKIDYWQKKYSELQTVTTSRFFGLIKSTKIVIGYDDAYGPKKEEICIVVDMGTHKGETYYTLQGYGDQWYNSNCFITLTELTATEIEILEQSKP